MYIHTYITRVKILEIWYIGPNICYKIRISNCVYIFIYIMLIHINICCIHMYACVNVYYVYIY